MSNRHECQCGVVPPHATFGACMRAKGVRIGYCQSAKGHDYTRQKEWDRELDIYERAVDQGLNPDGLGTDQVHLAEAFSEKIGVAYGTDAWDRAAEKHIMESAE